MRTVDEVMSTEVRTVRSDDVVGTLRAVLGAGPGHGVPVLDGGGSVVGMVTSSDLVGGPPDDAPVAGVMSDAVVTVGPRTTLSEAARELLERRMHHLVVIDNTRLVGIVSSLDLLRELVEEVAVLRPESGGSPSTAGPVARARVGDQVVIRSHAIGHERRGRITEVRGADGGPPYLVQWSDDPHDEPHEVLFFPGPDADVEPTGD